MNIVLGAMAPSLKEQLAGRLDEKTLDLLDADANAITRLLLRGHISDNSAKLARQRLMRSINAFLSAAGNTSRPF